MARVYFPVSSLIVCFNTVSATHTPAGKGIKTNKSSINDKIIDYRNSLLYILMLINTYKVQEGWRHFSILVD